MSRQPVHGAILRGAKPFVSTPVAANVRAPELSAHLIATRDQISE
jgi:hypothetical protein